MAVEIEKEGHLAIITLNRPEARNAINGEMAQTMESCLDEFENDPELWVGILKAEGTVFVLVQTLKKLQQATAGPWRPKRVVLAELPGGKEQNHSSRQLQE